MKKNTKIFSIMLRNQYFKASLNLNNKIKNLDKEKYDSTSTNILNEYKKLKESDCLNSDIKLSKTTSIYTKNIFKSSLRWAWFHPKVL